MSDALTQLMALAKPAAEIVDRLVEIDPATPDCEGWGALCFFCEAVIERGEEQHKPDCLWAVARQLRGLPFAVEKPAPQPPRPPGERPLVDTGTLLKSIVGFIIK